MNLIAGDSHVWGLELELDPTRRSFKGTDEEFRIKNRHGTILFNLLDIPHDTIARAGASNSWICTSVVDYIENTKTKIDNVVVSWTGITRIEKRHNGGPVFFNTLNPAFNKKVTVKLFPEVYNKIFKWEKLEHELFFDDIFFKSQSFHYINYLKLYLESKDINFIFIKSIESGIDLSRFGENHYNLSFVDFYLQNNFKVGRGKHGLLEAQHEWGKHLFERIGPMFYGVKKNFI